VLGLRTVVLGAARVADEADDGAVGFVVILAATGVLLDRVPLACSALACST
jgi:hypothetical protein